MNREIKFRVWYKKEKKMYEVWAIHWFGIDAGIELKGDARSIDFEDGEILQYTGLKDKNGKEIYEGYIIQKKHQKI